MSAFAGLPPQPEASRLLEAELASPRHAYLLSGPAGSGKRAYADRFASALLASSDLRVETRIHPDLVVVEPEGQAIPIDRVRELRRDLHLRPFEAARRVYLILDAHLLRDDSANALLKSLEEPPAYGVFLLVSDHAERMLPTIRSRVAAIPFRPFPEAYLRERTGDAVAARAALGSLDRALELAGEPEAAGRRRLYLQLAREARLEPAFDPAAAAGQVTGAASARGRRAAERVAEQRDRALAGIEDQRERKALEKRFEERAKRASRRAEVDELRLAVDTVALWYRDLLSVALGAESAVINSDLAGALQDDSARGAAGELSHVLSAVVETRRSLELNVQPGLAVEAMFHRMRRPAPVEG
ncbi:MAG: DNA polymerase III subunit [Gaiellales bacterium]